MCFLSDSDSVYSQRSFQASSRVGMRSPPKRTNSVPHRRPPKIRGARSARPDWGPWNSEQNEAPAARSRQDKMADKARSDEPEVGTRSDDGLGQGSGGQKSTTSCMGRRVQPHKNSWKPARAEGRAGRKDSEKGA